MKENQKESKFEACESGRECRVRTYELEQLRKRENQKSISDWGVMTFGYPKSIKTILDRMLKECEELKELSDQLPKYNDALYEKIADECADVYIVMAQVMDAMGYNLQSCVDHKMEINRARKWKLNGDGTAQHVKE